MKTIIRPIGSQLKRLKANTGLDHYTINGEVTAEFLEIYMGLPVWTFQYADVVEPEVRQHMLSKTMRENGWSEDRALEYLNRVRHAIPKHHVRIERVT